MPIDAIPFRDTNYFSNLICDYLDQKPELKQFYHRFPKLQNFSDQINDKKNNYPANVRRILAERLQVQHKALNLSPETKKNLQLLENENTFTITTGHQLNLFTGPLYFFYKIISAINLCKQLKQEYPQYNFIPTYWMASEDHDFEEINFFNFEGKKIQWNRDASGAVGHLDLNGLDEVAKVFSNQMNQAEDADQLRDLFKRAYLDHNSLTDAMRYLVNELFKSEGLIIVDGDDAELKQLFQPYMVKDIVENTSFNSVSDTIEEINRLEANYKIQVNPREINLFYLKGGLRERIAELDGKFIVNDTDISWTKEEILQELDANPERFSPNVILRPLYQEVILPNLCYIGGGGELAYWFQLKGMFKAYDVTLPILLLRNSALIINDKQLKKLDKLNVNVSNLFLNQDDLKSVVTKKASEIDVNFSAQKEHLKEQFKNLYTLAEQTDASFLGAVSAQERKQLNGLEHLEKRLLKAQKRKLADYLERVVEIQNELFPNQSLQERQANFSTFYQQYGDKFKEKLLESLNPLQLEFLILNV